VEREVGLHHHVQKIQADERVTELEDEENPRYPEEKLEYVWTVVEAHDRAQTALREPIGGEDEGALGVQPGRLAEEQTDRIDDAAVGGEADEHPADRQQRPTGLGREGESRQRCRRSQVSDRDGELLGRRTEVDIA
jgi:hypothetical protein